MRTKSGEAFLEVRCEECRSTFVAHKDAEYVDRQFVRWLDRHEACSRRAPFIRIPTPLDLAKRGTTLGLELADRAQRKMRP